MNFGLSDTVTFPPTLLDVAEWVMEACNVQEQIVCIAWMKKSYAWFTNGKEVEDRNGGVHIGAEVVSVKMLMLIQMLIQICLRDKWKQKYF